MTARTRLCHFVIDVPDLDHGVAFWTQALNAVDEPLPEISSQVYRHLRLPDTEIAVLLQKTNDKKASKERMHLDLEADDVEAEVRRLEALGATRLDHQQERGFDFWVMRDPWENEFCILQSDDPNVTAQRKPSGGEPTTAHLINYPGPTAWINIQANYTKWLIFGVALPLLPLAARVLAVFLNPFGVGQSFTDILGNGELLVIATVIAAAVIGDLLFEISDFDNTTSRIQAACLSAVALLIVVVSVLTYGLIAVNVQSHHYIGDYGAAVWSVIMFLSSFALGVFAVWFSTIRPARNVQTGLPT